MKQLGNCIGYLVFGFSFHDLGLGDDVNFQRFRCRTIRCQLKRDARQNNYFAFDRFLMALNIFSELALSSWREPSFGIISSASAIVSPTPTESSLLSLDSKDPQFEGESDLPRAFRKLNLRKGEAW